MLDAAIGHGIWHDKSKFFFDCEKESWSIRTLIKCECENSMRVVHITHAHAMYVYAIAYFVLMFVQLKIPPICKYFTQRN